MSVVGLGKLGSCLAACLASKGYQTLGIDNQRGVVDLVASHRAPVEEPGLQELLSKSKKTLTATSDLGRAIDETDITFIIVPTPSQKDGSFTDKYVRDVLGPLAKRLGDSKKAYHLFAITSTVSPGTIDGRLIPLIEKHSGRKVNDGFGMAYNPEFIALGSVIDDFKSPDMVLIGESDSRVGDMIEHIYGVICENDPHIARMSLISAEITKIALNSYVTMKISFANTLAGICEVIDGAQIDLITQAIGADKRISPHYIKGGMSFGGPCFPRDSRAFSSFAKEYGKSSHLSKATDIVNKERIAQIIKMIRMRMGKVKKLTVLGLSYKPGTPVVEESPSIAIIEGLLKKDPALSIRVYDRLATDNAKAELGDKVRYSHTLEGSLKGANAIVVATADKEFRKLGEILPKKPLILFDCWRMLREKVPDNVEYVSLGTKD